MNRKEFKGLIAHIKEYLTHIKIERRAKKKTELCALYNAFQKELNNGYWSNDISKEMKQGLFQVPNGKLYKQYIYILKGVDYEQ